MNTMDQSPIEPYAPQSPAAIDPDLRKRAVERIEARQNFVRHLSTYGIMSAVLVVIWFASGADYFWPIWPMLGWGIGLAFHAMSLRNHQVSEEQIAAEAAKLSSSPTPAGPQDRV